MKTRDLTLNAVLLAILIICSQITLPLGPVPVTLQTFGVVLIGLIVKPRHAFVITFLYMVVGLIGFPVFSGGSAGLQSFLIPSFGFVISFIPAATLQSYYLDKKSVVRYKEFIIAAVINFVITYVIGLAYMAFIFNMYLGNALTFPQILLTGFIPLIPGDLLKIFTAILLGKRLRPQLQFYLIKKGY